MVTVYKPWVEPGYYWTVPVGSTKPLLELRSRARGEPWEPIWLFMVTTDPEGRPRRSADMPWCGSQTMALKEPARRILEPVLGDDAEWLPAYDSDGENLWLVHPWRLVDALDEDHSDLVRFQDGVKIMRVNRYALRGEAVAGMRCFRLPQQPHIMFVTDEVASAVSAAGFHGTGFVPIWRSLLHEF
jgi:hypothetical protein